MAAIAFMQDLGHSLAGTLLRFNLLPTRLYPASRRHEWLPREFDALAARGYDLAPWHRHASAALLRRGDLGLVRTVDDPALPLCLCEPQLFDRLLLACGLAILAPQIRRVIARAEVACLLEQLGEAGLEFARHHAPVVGDGLEPGPTLEPAFAGAQARRVGGALLSEVFGKADPAVGQRGLMRLPPAADFMGVLLPPAVFRNGAALSLARTVLKELDPEWLSSFPDPR